MPTPEVTKEGDVIHRPAHYTATEVEPIDVIEAWGLGFCLGNVVKYIARAELKGAPLEDLRKARWYLDREIAARGGEPVAVAGTLVEGGEAAREIEARGYFAAAELLEDRVKEVDGPLIPECVNPTVELWTAARKLRERGRKVADG